MGTCEICSHKIPKSQKKCVILNNIKFATKQREQQDSIKYTPNQYKYPSNTFLYHKTFIKIIKGGKKTQTHMKRKDITSTQVQA